MASEFLNINEYELLQYMLYRKIPEESVYEVFIALLMNQTVQTVLYSFNGSPQSLISYSSALKLLHYEAAGWCVSKYCPHKNMCPPQSVSDHSAAA